MGTFPSIRNVAGLGKIRTKRKKMAWNILFSQWRQLHQPWKKRPCICWQSWWQTSVFIATSVFITISNVCIYCGICANLFIVNIINCTGKSRCHRYLLSEFQEITNIFSTIWYRQISQGMLSQSKHSSRMMCMWYVKIASCLQRDWKLDCYSRCQLIRMS